MIEELIDFLQKRNILPSIIGISIGIYVSLLANSLSDNIIKPILNELIDEKRKIVLINYILNYQVKEIDFY
jgi:large-conductance mechanosensitive channel